MNIQIEEISSIKKKLSIQVSYDQYLKEIDKAYQKLSQQVNIKGFRKGKVPRNILEKYYKEQTEADALGHVIEHSYVHALQEHKIDPVAPPAVTDIKKDKDQPISFVAEVEVFPQVEAKDYKGIPIKSAAIEVKDSEINEELTKLQTSMAQMQPVDDENTKAENGFVAIIDFEGKLNGESFEGGNGKAVTLELGAGHFLKDFEEGVLGMKKGEQKVIDVAFPAEYPNKKLAGNTAKFDLTVTDLKKKVLPTLDDEFAKDLGQFETLAQVKEKISENLKAKKDQDQKREESNQILEYLISKNPSIELPEVMIEQEIKALYDNTLNQFRQQGINPEQIGLNYEQYKTNNRENAIRRIKAFVLFESIGKQENVTVTQDDLKARISTIAKSVGQPEEMVQNYYEQQKMFPSLFAQIKEEKILDFLRQNAKLS